MGLPREDRVRFTENRVKRVFGEAGNRSSGNQASLVPLLAEWICY